MVRELKLNSPNAGFSQQQPIKSRVSGDLVQKIIRRKTQHLGYQKLALQLLSFTGKHEHFSANPERYHQVSNRPCLQNRRYHRRESVSPKTRE